MKKLLALLFLIACAQTAAAQNLVITNARILDGKGGAIERGSIAVRDGKIASVAAGAVSAPSGARVIDAQGRTVMPGYIDAHRHLIDGDGQRWLKEQAPARMQEFLDAGFTTVLSAIDQRDAILELRRKLQAGEIKGPRVFSAAFIPLAGQAAPRGGGAQRGGGQPQGDPARFDNSRPPRRPTTAAPGIPREQTIKDVETAAKMGFDYIKTVITTTPGGPEKDTLKLIVQEGKKRNLPTITHAVSVIDTLAAVEAGPAVLVHTPHIGRLEEDPAAVQKIAGARIPMTSTLAVFIPHFGRENKPLFRDGLPFPWDTISSAGQGPVNARLLWEAGISYGYGTDTRWPPRESLADELRALQVVFSAKDIVTILTKNAASSVLRSDQIGTLESGKLADIVILNADPLANVTNLLDVRMVIKGGVVVVDKSTASRPSTR
jgi:imidazolonepropionase-like amidohydrolase